MCYVIIDAIFRHNRNTTIIIFPPVEIECVNVLIYVQLRIDSVQNILLIHTDRFHVSGVLQFLFKQSPIVLYAEIATNNRLTYDVHE